MHTRDIIVIGASMGGVEALSTLASRLPANLPASVLVVQHTSADSPGLMAEILERAGPLPASMVEDFMPLVHGRIYVARPDRHLLLVEQGVLAVHGPKENRARPAIDPLFRTAAVHGRSRVIGVVLTGLLGDGAAGLSAIHRCGGVALVQSPEDALCAEMPRRAIAAVPDAVQLPLEKIPFTLAWLTAQAAPEPPPVPEAIRIEARLTERAMAHDDWGGIPSRSTDFTCPECGGALREIEEDGPVRRFRCRVGHAYGADDMLAQKADGVETALWVALQTLQEQAQMLDALATEDRRRGWVRNATGYEERARELRAAADRLRELVGTITAGRER